ncbi:MAG: RDD family protein [Verrucomicrobiota bacterium]
MFTILGADGKEYGPVPAARVAEWIAGGRANLETKARRAGDAEWRTLGNFVEFNPAAPPPPLPAADVAAPAPVSAPMPELAGRGTRLGAFLLDYVLSVLVALPGALIIGPAFVGLLLAATRGEQPDFSVVDTGTLLLGLAVLSGGSLLLLVVQVVMLSTRGQTIGKRLLGIRVVRHPDGLPAGFVHAWLLRNFVTGVIQVVPWIGFVFYLADALFIFTPERRCLHDLIAGTKVVQA